MDDARPGLNIMDNNETLSDQNYFLLRAFDCQTAVFNGLELLSASLVFLCATILMFCFFSRGNYRTRKTLESWHTTNTKDADNNSKPLPEPLLNTFKLISSYIVVIYHISLAPHN